MGESKSGIATASWHLNIPKDFQNYNIGDRITADLCTFGTDSNFILENCIIEGKKEKQFWDKEIKNLADQLIRLQNENIPLIFRPLHEAEGNGGVNGEGAWFWWGKSGAETYVKVWKYLYNKLTKEYEIHNLIWEQNLYIYSSDSTKWYSGEEYVDIIGYDKYNVEHNRHDGKASGPNLDAESNIFYALVRSGENKKMVALAENDSIPSLNNLKVEKAGWLYFNPWYGNYILDENMNTKESIKEIYGSDYCISLEDLPKLREEMENIQCSKIKRIYNEDTCSSAPTTSFGLKCILKLEGNNKSCQEVKKSCLEIKNGAGEEICDNAPSSDSNKKCKLNKENINECQEIVISNTIINSSILKGDESLEISDEITNSSKS